MFVRAAGPSPYQPAPPPLKTAAPPAPAPPPPAPAPPPVVPKYWAAGGQSFLTLADVGKAVQTGQVAMQPNGRLDVAKVVYGDIATLKAAHDKAAVNFLKSGATAFGVGLVVSLIAAPLAPLAIVAGTGLAIWNGVKALQEHQASADTAAPGYYVAEKGRMTVSPGTNPPQFGYRAVDSDKWYDNLVPSQPFRYKPAVSIDKAD